MSSKYRAKTGQKSGQKNDNQRDQKGHRPVPAKVRRPAEHPKAHLARLGARQKNPARLRGGAHSLQSATRSSAQKITTHRSPWGVTRPHNLVALRGFFVAPCCRSNETKATGRGWPCCSCYTFRLPCYTSTRAKNCTEPSKNGQKVASIAIF